MTLEELRDTINDIIETRGPDLEVHIGIKKCDVEMKGVEILEVREIVGIGSGGFISPDTNEKKHAVFIVCNTIKEKEDEPKEEIKDGKNKSKFIFDRAGKIKH